MSNRAGSRLANVLWAHALRRPLPAWPRRGVVRRAAAAPSLRVALLMHMHLSCAARRVGPQFARERTRSPCHARKQPARSTCQTQCAMCARVMRAIPAAFDISYLNCACPCVATCEASWWCGLRPAHVSKCAWCEQMRSHCVCGSLYDPLACSRALSIAL